MTTLIEKFQEATKANNNEDDATISVRQSLELAAMVEAMSVATQQPVVNMFTTDLSSYLAGYLLEDKKNMDLIKQIVTDEYEKNGSRISEVLKGSCLDVLSREGHLKVEETLDWSEIDKEMAALDLDEE